MKQYESWGRNPKVTHSRVEPILWRDTVPDLKQIQESILPRGYGRSYGDSCLNAGGALLDVTPLRRFIAFDEETGLLRCEAGVMLADILEMMVPRGWFVPVTPGTKYVSIGGAIANDVHGKNHHAAGTFGCYVTQFELLRSDGRRLICSPTENADLYSATIGGLGLTGLILWAEFKLKRISGPFIDIEHIRFGSLDEFFQISAESDRDYEYTVAWADCIATGKRMGRGIFMRGNHSQKPYQKVRTKPLITVPFDFPSFVGNIASAWAFNQAIYYSQIGQRTHKVAPYEPFFYPLDVVNKWYRLYGKRGFYQYQLVVPEDNDNAAIREVLERISHSGEASFLAVLKKFGDMKSPGMLSFPRPGVTLALDFPNNGKKSLKLFEDLDRIVRQAHGAVYPAKDARMSPESFQCYFPNWHEFARYIDPKFSSSFWRRVTATPTIGK